VRANKDHSGSTQVIDIRQLALKRSFLFVPEAPTDSGNSPGGRRKPPVSEEPDSLQRRNQAVGYAGVEPYFARVGDAREFSVFICGATSPKFRFLPDAGQELARSLDSGLLMGLQFLVGAALHPLEIRVADFSA
jgi:hypothetical protein